MLLVDFAQLRTHFIELNEFLVLSKAVFEVLQVRPSNKDFKAMKFMIFKRKG